MGVLPETDVARVQRWCRGRVPEHVRNEIRVEVDVADRHLTIVECRPPWRADLGPDWTRSPIARLRYTKGRVGPAEGLARPVVDLVGHAREFLGSDVTQIDYLP